MSKPKQGETTPRNLLPALETLSPIDRAIVNARILGMFDGFNDAWRIFKQRTEIAFKLRLVMKSCDEIVLYSDGEQRRQRLEQLYDEYAALMARYFDQRRTERPMTEAGFAALGIDFSPPDDLMNMLQARLEAWNEARRGDFTELRRMAALDQGKQLAPIGHPGGSAAWREWLYEESKRIKQQSGGAKWERVAEIILENLPERLAKEYPEPSREPLRDEIEREVRSHIDPELESSPGRYLMKLNSEMRKKKRKSP